MTNSPDNSPAPTSTKNPGEVPPSKWPPGHIHFALTLGILLIVGIVIHTYGWIIKKPVEWPEAVAEVTAQYRNASMPDSFGPYEAIPESDPLYDRNEIQDGPDLIIREDSLGLLGMRTIYNDDERRAQRRSNWYGIRLYRDTRESQFSPLRYWQLEIYYYTGLRDQIPHVPNICLNAAGATSIKQDSIVLRAPEAREPWNGDLRYQRVSYATRQQGGGEVPGVTYYILGLNDEPVSTRSASAARLIIRIRLSSRDVYNYFVKIQFSPRGGRQLALGGRRLDLEQADQAAQEFVESFLPVIVEFLPTGEFIRELEQAEEAGND